MFVSVTAIAFQTCGKVVPSASGQLLCLIYCPSVWLIRAAGKSQKEFPPYLHWVTPSNPLPPLHPYSSLELIRTSSHFYSLLPQCPLALSDRLQVYASVSDDSLAGVLVTHSQMPGWLWVCLLLPEQPTLVSPPIPPCGFVGCGYWWAASCFQSSHVTPSPCSPALWQSHSFSVLFFSTKSLLSPSSFLLILMLDTDFYWR